MDTSQATGTLPRRDDPYTNPLSLEFGFRAKRFAKVQGLIQRVIDRQGRCRVLDLGGTETYWRIGGDFLRQAGARLHITLVNTERQEPSRSAMFDVVQGSASDPSLFEGERFDVVHSNSVIEHVGSQQEMERFAENTRRLAPSYYCQTPNYWFPFEPHFRTVGFQYLPRSVRVATLRRFELGFFRRVPDKAEAEDVVRHHELVSTRQMRRFFPDAAISHETFLGLRKSIVAVRDRSS